jgi:hypothetical protein
VSYPSVVSGEFFDKDDVLTDKIVVRSTKYRTGQIVILKVESDDVIQAGRILKIVVRRGKVFFLVRRYDCARGKFRYFDALPVDLALVKYSSVRDYKPLICRSDEECPKFLLHHHLPVVFEN